MKKAVDAIWYQGFYRKNYLMFFLLAFVFGFFANPPYLFFSRHFIYPMFESPAFLGGTLGLFALYWIKGIMDSIKILHTPENKALYLLLTLSEWKLLLILGRQLLFILAPVFAYVFVMALHGYSKNPLMALSLVLGNVLALLFAIRLMGHQLRHPHEKVWRQDWQGRLGEQFRQSLSYISLLSLWHHSGRLLLFVKGISLALLFALSLAKDWSDKAYFLCMWSVICMQGILFFRLRQKEDGEIFLLRNLPISRGKRWLAYLLSTAILASPEILLWIFLGPDRLLSLDLFMAYLGMGMLGIAILYHQALELGTFISYLLGFFLLGFVILLFGMPLLLFGMGILGFSWWVFWEEYYKWNGWEKE